MLINSSKPKATLQLNQPPYLIHHRVINNSSKAHTKNSCYRLYPLFRVTHLLTAPPQTAVPPVDAPRWTWHTHTHSEKNALPPQWPEEAGLPSRPSPAPQLHICIAIFIAWTSWAPYTACRGGLVSCSRVSKQLQAVRLLLISLSPPTNRSALLDIVWSRRVVVLTPLNFFFRNVDADNEHACAWSCPNRVNLLRCESCDAMQR